MQSVRKSNRRKGIRSLLHHFKRWRTILEPWSTMLKESRKRRSLSSDNIKH